MEEHSPTSTRLPLLKTKTYLPPVRQGLAARAYKRLNEDLSHNLTLVSAPAGYGKTTRQCASARACRVPALFGILERFRDLDLTSISVINNEENPVEAKRAGFA